jgi:hypothetical protein
LSSGFFRKSEPPATAHNLAFGKLTTIRRVELTCYHNET